MFEIVANPEKQLLHITLHAFWDVETMASYSKSVWQKSEELRRSAGCTRILINMVDYPIQSKTIAAGHATNLHVVKARGEARVALVMQSALSKLQAARVPSDTGHSTFDTEEEALAWLLSDGQATVPSGHGSKVSPNLKHAFGSAFSATSEVQLER